MHTVVRMHRELVHLLQALADLKWMPTQAWLTSYSVVFKCVLSC